MNHFSIITRPVEVPEALRERARAALAAGYEVSLIDGVLYVQATPSQEWIYFDPLREEMQAMHLLASIGRRYGGASLGTYTGGQVSCNVHPIGRVNKPTRGVGAIAAMCAAITEASAACYGRNVVLE